MVIGPDGSQLGVMSRNEALEKAYDEDLDLLFFDVLTACKHHLMFMVELYICAARM